MPNARAMAIIFEGTVATGKNTWIPNSQIPKESIENSKDSSRSEEFFDPQCESPVNVDEMKVEFSLLLRVGLESNKGKGLATHSKFFFKRHSIKTLNFARNDQLFEVNDRYHR